MPAANQMNTVAAHHDSLEPQKAYVALFDVLGFKKRLSDEGLGTTLNTYLALVRAKTEAGSISIATSSGLIHHQVGSTIFSDTILFWCDDNLDAARSILSASAHLISDAIDMGWPLRGGLAYGDCVLDRDSRTFIGQPIVDAHETEQSQQWIGASLHRSMLEHSTDGASIQRQEDVIKYPVPTKKDTLVLKYAIHWCPYSFRARKSLTQLRANQTDAKVALYYDNTTAYIQKTCSEFHSAQP